MKKKFEILIMKTDGWHRYIAVTSIKDKNNELEAFAGPDLADVPTRR